MNSPPSSSSSSSYASFPMVAVTILGILATIILLASYYAFITKCQLLRHLMSHHSWRHRNRHGPTAIVTTFSTESQGLGLPLIHMIPIVKFSRTIDASTAKIPLSDCAVCLTEFQEQERVRLLPNCSHAFHIDCIDTWLQGNSNCPFCRSEITLPLESFADHSGYTDCQELSTTSILIEMQDGHGSRSHTTPRRDQTLSPWDRKKLRRYHNINASLGDEVIDTRQMDEQFIVQPLRRSLSMDSSSDKQLYLSIQEMLRERKDLSS